jgi:hypothetical protein
VNREDPRSATSSPQDDLNELRTFAPDIDDGSVVSHRSQWSQ